MPTIGSFHSLYWGLSDTTVTPALAASVGGYPRWQIAVVAPSLFGAIGAWWDALWARVQYWRRFIRRWERLSVAQRTLVVQTLDAVEGFTDEQRAITGQVLATLNHPAFPLAQIAVRGTATTLGFNRPEAWRDLSRAIKSDPGRAQNLFRHLDAMRRVRGAVQAQGSTLSNPQQNLVTELAYVGFAWKGR